MVTDDEPPPILQQVETPNRRKRLLSPEQLTKLAQQDWRVLGLLVRLRSGEPVADELLTELLPAVRGRSARWRPVRLYGRDDLQQELAAELLRVARSVPLTRADFVTRRLMLAAARRVTRRLEREWYRQLEQVRLTELDGASGRDEQ